MLGINFARDGMQEKDWLSSVTFIMILGCLLLHTILEPNSGLTNLTGISKMRERWPAREMVRWRLQETGETEMDGGWSTRYREIERDGWRTERRVEEAVRRRFSKVMMTVQ